MSFEENIQRVKRAEGALDVTTRKVNADWQRLRLTWREAWTPGRIVIAGMASGFVVGRGELPTATGSGVINLVNAVSNLFAVDQADLAAEVAEEAVDQAQQVAEATTDASGVEDAAADDEPVRAHEALRRSGAW